MRSNPHVQGESFMNENLNSKHTAPTNSGAPDYQNTGEFSVDEIIADFSRDGTSFAENSDQRLDLDEIIADFHGDFSDELSSSSLSSIPDLTAGDEPSYPTDPVDTESSVSVRPNVRSEQDGFNPAASQQLSMPTDSASSGTSNEPDGADFAAGTALDNAVGADYIPAQSDDKFQFDSAELAAEKFCPTEPCSSTENTQARPLNKKLNFGVNFSDSTEDFDKDYTTSDFSSGTIENTYDTHQKLNRKNKADIHIPYDLLGDENINYSAASDKFGRKASAFYVKAVFCFAFFLLCSYLTIAPAYGIFVPEFMSYASRPYISLCILISAQILAMLLCLDIIASGFFRLFCLRPTMDSVTAVASSAVLIHAISIVLFPKWGGYLPYCAVSCAALCAALISRYQKYTALRKKFKVLSMSDTPFGVFSAGSPDGTTRIFKNPFDKTALFFKSLTEPNDAERYSLFFAPIILCVTLIFSVLSSFSVGHSERFFWAFAAVSSAALPFCMLISSSLPDKKSACVLCSRGAAISSVNIRRDIKKCREAVLCDDDIFPAGTVSVNGFKLVGTNNFEKVFSYTAAVLIDGEVGIGALFSDLLKQQLLRPAHTTSLIHHEGGISARIGSDEILVGTSGFLIRMGVKVREGLEIKHGVFTAINSNLVGIFALKYLAAPSVSVGFGILSRRHIAPIAATRDFNITPGMIEKKFKLKRGVCVYPDINERISLSDRHEDLLEFPFVVMPFSGIRPFAEGITIARRFAKSSRRNLFLSTAASIIGVILLTFLARGAEYSAAAPHNLLFYNLLWLVPIILSSSGSSKN